MNAEVIGALKSVLCTIIGLGEEKGAGALLDLLRSEVDVAVGLCAGVQFGETHPQFSSNCNWFCTM